MKNCQSKISLATCHYCQSSWQFSQSSSPKPPLDHLTPGPNSRDSLGPAEWYRVVKHLHIDIVYNTSTFSFNPPPTPPQPRRKKWSLTRCGKDPCRIVLTQSPEWRSHTKRPLKQMLESVFRYCHLLFVITYSWPGSTCDHPMSVRCYTRESSASVLLQPKLLLVELKESLEEQNSPDKSDPKSGCIQTLPPEYGPLEPAGHNLFHHVRKNDWRPWHFVRPLRQVVAFLWAPVSSYPTHTAFLWFDKGAGSFHIHRKTMKELCILAVLGVREQPNLAQNLVTHRHW